MNRRLTAALAAATLTLILAAAPASAGTQRQFDLIEYGWTKSHTEDVIEDHGERVGSYTGNGGAEHIVKFYIIGDTGEGWWIDYRQWDNGSWHVYKMWGDQA